jgi:hypothetical protein
MLYGTLMWVVLIDRHKWWKGGRVYDLLWDPLALVGWYPTSEEARQSIYLFTIWKCRWYTYNHCFLKTTSQYFISPKLRGLKEIRMSWNKKKITLYSKKISIIFYVIPHLKTYWETILFNIIC